MLQKLNTAVIYNMTLASQTEFHAIIWHVCHGQVPITFIIILMNILRVNTFLSLSTHIQSNNYRGNQNVEKEKKIINTYKVT